MFTVGQFASGIKRYSIFFLITPSTLLSGRDVLAERTAMVLVVCWIGFKIFSNYSVRKPRAAQQLAAGVMETRVSCSKGRLCPLLWRGFFPFFLVGLLAFETDYISSETSAYPE